jgi:hypothetical protein
MYESSTEIRKKQLEKFHEESREQLLEQAIMIDHCRAACMWESVKECTTRYRRSWQTSPADARAGDWVACVLIG